jgi:cytochrome P450
MSENPPVTDWTTDFDHTDEVWSQDPYPIWDDLRQGCPVAHSDRYGGVWLPTRHDDISSIAYDTDRFTSRFIVVGPTRPPEFLAPAGPVPPISSDPPYHHGARRKLIPPFSPKEIAKIEPATRAFCHQLIDAMEGRDVVDAAADYAQHIPVRVIADMLGFPQEDADTFRTFVHNFLEGITIPLEERLDEIMELFGYLQKQVDDHMENPRDDLTTYLINLEEDPDSLRGALERTAMGEIDEEILSLTPEQRREIREQRELEAAEAAQSGLAPEEPPGGLLPPVLGTMALLLIAGIDTTWSAIGASIWHLAGHPEDRRRLAEEPELWPTALEELLRAYAPVTMARLVREDMDWNGCPMKKDDWVLLPFPAANRDPEVFTEPERVILDRQNNRHAAFGLGIHRCIGSHLARMELRVALEVWMERFPDFDLTDPSAVTWSKGQVRGPRRLPVRVTAPVRR